MRIKKIQIIRASILSLLIGFSCSIALSQSNNYFETSKNIEIFTELYKELDMFYVDELSSGELIKTAIDQMLNSLDPYTTYYPESEIEDYRFMTTGQYGGIGAMITKRGDYVIITEPYEGFAAQKAGLMAGDKILEINGVSAKAKTTEQVSTILKGSPNTKVNILIERNNKNIEFSFNRENVSINSISYYGIVEDQIGYIKLRSFTRNCANDLKKSLVDLKQENELKGIILDLRSNPGGLLNESIDIVNLFIEKGEEIVTTKGKTKDWEKTYKTKHAAIDTETPLIVLINGSSASASEIVSGSIQDLDRGVIIGKRSYGKGLVQQTRKLPYNSQLKVTVAKYYIPSGRCIQALDYSKKNIKYSGEEIDKFIVWLEENNDEGIGYERLNSKIDQIRSRIKIPDSLSSTYTTRNGREVKDGGGIYPDIEIQDEEISDITISLIKEKIFFDFATLFRNRNPTISPVEEFIITEDIFNQFKEFLETKEYKYKTDTEAGLQFFKDVSDQDGTSKLISEELDLILQKIEMNKTNDLENHKLEILDMIENEIVSRYYYQKGRVQQLLKNDNGVKEAIRVINNLEEYKKVLNDF